MGTSKTKETVSFTTSQPPAFVSEWKRHADAQGMTYSAWVAAACNARLPKNVQRRLPTRTKPGRTGQ